MTKKTSLNQGEVTDTQIQAWKNKYGDKVFSMDVAANEDGKEKVTGYFRKPDLKVISAASKFMTEDPLKGAEIIFDNCFLGGDPLFKEDDEIKMSAMTALSSVFKVRTVEIKNL